MQRELVAANVAPGVMPPFLKHVPRFRRDDKKTPKPIHIDADVYKFEVQPGVSCGGCVEP